MKNNKKIIILIILVLILLVGYLFYFKKKPGSRPNQNPNINESIVQGDSICMEISEEFKKIVIPGLRIVKIENDSPLNQVSLVALKRSESEKDSLLAYDIITGISLDYDKTNFSDILLRERESNYFIPVNSEEELYSEINKSEADKIMLGVARKTSAGTGCAYRPDIATFSVKKTGEGYLKATLLPNSKELYR